MKLLSLDLIAYGPFTNVRLDFSSGQHGLHVVYGPNEAGKSSSLWALRYFLFGFDHLCRGDFRHNAKQLRVGGAVQDRDGHVLRCVRRRGKVGTLRDPSDEETVDPRRLADLLGAIDSDTFWQRFAIDHQRLTEGGQAILRGDDVGQVLFAAGAGLANLGSVQKALQDEAAQLFVGGAGGKKRINAELAELKQLRSRVDELQLSLAVYEQEQSQLEAAKQRKQQLEARLAAVRAECDELQRRIDAWPLVAKRRVIAREREALDGTRPLSADFTVRRREAETQLNRERLKAEQAQATLAELDAELATLAAPAAVLEAEPDIQALGDEAGAYTQADKDRPQLVAEFQALQRSIHEALLSLNRDEHERPSRINPGDAARLQSVGDRRQTLLAQQDAARLQAEKLRRRIADVAASLEALPAAGNLDELRRAVTFARQQGDIEDRAAALATHWEESRRQAESDLRALGRWRGDLAALAQASLPTVETIDRFVSETAETRQRLQRAEQTLRERQRQLDESERQLERLGGEGRFTEADLSAARKRRDEAWRLVRRAWEDGVFDLAEFRALIADAPTDDLAEAYELCVVQADQVADELRKFAAQGGQRETVLAQREQQRELVQRATEDLAQAEAKQQSIDRDWQALWHPLGIQADSPLEMRAWRDRAERLVAASGNLQRLQAELAALQSRIATCRHPLLAALNATAPPTNSNPAPVASSPEPLAMLLDRAEAAIRRDEELRSRRTEAEQELARLRGDLLGHQAEIEMSQSALAKWQEEWTAAVVPLSLSPETTPEAARALVAEIQEIVAKWDRLADLQTRIARIDAYMQQFAEQVRGVAVRVLGSGGDGAVKEVVAALSRRLVDAKTAQSRGETLRRQRDQAAATLASAEEAIRAAQALLTTLCREAGCANPDELPLAEQRAQQQVEVERQWAELEERLLTLARTTPLEEFCRAASVDPAQSRARWESLQAELAELERERSDLDQTIGERRQLLATMNGNAQAAAARQEAESLIAQIAADSEDYLRLRLASIVLREATERYRQRHQGPVLRMASACFSALTLHSFAALKPGHNDKGEPVLVGVRPSGEEVSVEGMSDGTCDQLYLALRLASLYDYLNRHEPLPFIVDDILHRFDDDRAVAALKALAELSRQTQVIFFTHHEHLVRLAERHLDSNVAFVQRLGEASG